MLNIDDDLVRQQIAISVNRSVVIVVLIIGIVSPSWIPISRVPIIVSTCYEHNNDIMLLPPNLVVALVAAAAKSLQITNAIVIGCFPMFNICLRRGVNDRLR